MFTIPWLSSNFFLLVSNLMQVQTFIDEYIKNVLCCIYDSEDIEIRCVGDVSSSYSIKIKYHLKTT